MKKSKDQIYSANPLKQKEDKKLKELEYKERYLALFNTSTDGIVLIDYETGKILDCNIEFINHIIA